MRLKNQMPRIVLAALLSSFLVACGGKGGFEVAPSRQAQSSLEVDTKPLPPTSSAQIIKGEDPTVLEKDPILHDPKNSNSEQLAVPEKDSLPTNTYGTVRVKLFPILQGLPKDPYVKTAETDRLRLRNEGGLHLRNLNAAASFDKTGKEIEISFSEKTVLVDGESVALEEGLALGVFPVSSEVLTEVELAVNPAFKKELKISQAGHSYLSFRGLFLVKNRQLINYLPTEDYLRSVVPSEIGENFEAEAIKAQAIAARSYVLRSMKKARVNELKEWDVDPTTRFQLYLGASVEKAPISTVVDQTTGQFLSFEGAPALAMYHSSSGGKTVKAKIYFCRRLLGSSGTRCANDMEKQYPYLSGVDDPNNNDRKRLGHGLGLPQMSAQEMAKKGSAATEILQTYYPGVGFDQF